MKAQKIVPGLYRVPLPGASCFVLDGGDEGPILFDAGLPRKGTAIRGALRSLGWDVPDVRHILITHGHPDHIGSLAELKGASGATVYMHRSDARLVAEGQWTRRNTVAPGLVSRVLYRVMILPMLTEAEAVETDEFIEDRAVLPFAGGVEVIHTPGHTEGHVVFLIRELGAVILGDLAINVLGLREIPIYENRRQGLMSLARLAGHDFDIACFGHGETLRARADRAFRRKWGSAAARP